MRATAEERTGLLPGAGSLQSVVRNGETGRVRNEGRRRRGAAATCCGCATAMQHMRGLLYKNRLLKQREWGKLGMGCFGLPKWMPTSLFCELLLPLGLVGFLWWAHNKCTSSGQCTQVVVAGWGGKMPPGVANDTMCRPGLPIPLSPGDVSHCDGWSNHYLGPELGDVPNFFDVRTGAQDSE